MSKRLPQSWRARITAFDAQADVALERLRNDPVADRLFYAASELGDFSLVWHIVGLTRGVLTKDGEREAIRLSVLLGAESVLVNGVIKSFFRRTRPEWEQPRSYRIRQPRSSSFPSGHASAAFTAATILADGSPWWPAYYAAAAMVATSRAHVKIHHASDVVGGVATGLVLGRIARRAWPRGRTS